MPNPVPPTPKISKQALSAVTKLDSNLNSDLNMNEDDKVDPPVSPVGPQSQIRNLRKLTKTMRENDSYKRLGL